MESLARDLRHALRGLSRTRGVSLVAIATLALGIGATTTMFSATYATLLRPVPFPEPDRLVLLSTLRTTPREGRVLSRWSRPLLTKLEESVTSFETIASFSGALVALSGAGGDPEQIDGEVVSPDYFKALRVEPAVGRTFFANEDAIPGEPPVVVVSDRLWRVRCAADPALVGRALRINDVSLTVIGILPPGFEGLTGKAQVWIPRTMAPRLTYADYLTTPQLFMPVVARLKAGVSIERANAELAALAARFRDPASTPDTQWGAIAQSITQARVEPSTRRSVLLLLAAAVCVLVIACANVAGLLLARGRARRREIAIRMAIGSGRARIVRQLVTESVLLATIAGACGTLLAVWGIDIFNRFAPAVLLTGRNPVASFSVPSLDRYALLFALAATLTTSVLCGLAPALDTSQARLTSALKEDGRSGHGGRQRLFGALVIGQVAVAMLLLTAAGILLGSFAHLQDLRRGFESDDVLTFWVRPPVSRYPVTDGPSIVERLLTSIERVPGVESAAVNRCTPFTGCSRSVVFFPDRPNDPEHAPVVGRHYASADYFRTLGIPILAGRVLTSGDRADRPPVAVVNESGARRFWPGQNPLGKHVWFGTSTGPFSNPAQAVEIVGVVGDVKYEAADWPDSEGRPEFFTSYLQFSYPDTMVIVKTRGSTSALIPSLRRAVASVDTALPIYDVLTLDQRITRALARPRFNGVLVGGFAAGALLLAAVGVYGMLSYSVSCRAREMGVRLALGARPGALIALVVGEGVRLAAAGAALGLGGALAEARLMRGLVVGMEPADPRVLAGVVILMMAAACVAAFVPARRASSVDPIVVLRAE
jgi:putative ABC transport system permease protein